MLYDRPYMKDRYSAGRTSVLGWLIAAIVAGFVLQNVFTRLFNAGDVVERVAGLTPSGLRAGQVWTLFTYSLLHSPSNLLHILGNIIGLYFLGRALLPLLGARRFLWLYAGAVGAGGAFWLAVNWHTGGVLLGASAGVSALLVVFACFYPDQEMTFLLFFILPVTLKPKYLALGCLAIDLAGCVFYEILGAPSPFGFAHSAHLGGMAAGWVYFRYIHDADWSTGRKAIEFPRWMKRASRPAAALPAAGAGVAAASRDALRAEVDRILDKINSQGFGALTADEKRVLDEARDLLSRR
jgi:membrane associated rhomboid family serine protease